MQREFEKQLWEGRGFSPASVDPGRKCPEKSSSEGLLRAGGVRRVAATSPPPLSGECQWSLGRSWGCWRPGEARDGA